MTTQPLDLKKLREVADRATPGPWLYRGKSNSWHHAPDPGTTYSYGRSILDDDNELKEEDVSFVETFNPKTILALLDAYEANARDAERYRWLRDTPQEKVEVFFATNLNPSGWGDWNSWEDKDAGIDAARHAVYLCDDVGCPQAATEHVCNPPRATQGD